MPGSGGDPRANTDDALVAVFLSKKWSTPHAELLFEAPPDSNGHIEKQIPKNLIGKK